MDEQKFREGINEILPTLKLFVAGFNDGSQSFINYLNKLDKTQIQKFITDYSNRKQEKINKVRMTILQRLLNGSISVEIVNQIFEEEKKLWPEGTLKVWTLPRIIYPFCYGEDRYYDKFLRKFLVELADDVILKAGYDKLKISEPGNLTFDGSNNFGKSGFYVAFGNNTHPDYTTMNQFRIESEGDDILHVGIYHHKQGFITGEYKTFDINTVTLKDVIDEAKECKEIVESDIYTGPAKSKIGSISPLSTPTNSMTSVVLNTILYGVPGTGKTYNTINYAVAAIEGKSIEEVCKEDWNMVKNRYNQYKIEGQIVFTTFHQSFGYEDFIEGIKAKVEDTGKINYEVESGIFKNLCEVAESEENINLTLKSDVDIDKVQIFKMSLGAAGKEDDIYDYCMQNNVIATGFGDIDFTQLPKNASCKDIKDFLRKTNPNKEIGFTADAIFRFKTWMNTGDLVLISKGNLYLRAIGKVTSEYYYDENTPIEYKHFRKVEWLLKDVNIPVERINNKKFSMQSIYGLKDDAYKETTLKLDEIKKLIGITKSKGKRNYVLIIDEINRGNISKIFGELITLIEPNKRLGNSEELKVKLPYSHDDFGVPNNLYILGTMNTADRSIALMDLALRRRFTFKEIEANSTLLEGIDINGINIKAFFEIINKRIEFLYDRDHLLGHAYFLSLKKNPTIEELNHIMLNKIIPQLQEYFHDDWGKIQLVLGDGIIKSEMVSAQDLGINSSDYEDQRKYTINSNISVQDYLQCINQEKK